MKSPIIYLCFGFFVCANLYVTLTQKTIYPMNSYQMFSKNWLVKNRISGIEILVDGHRLPIQVVSQNPFFQTNKIALDTYYTGSDPKQKLIFCQWLLEITRGRHIVIEGVMKDYQRRDGKVVETYGFQEKVFECTKSKMT